jgi:hypothetical protein
VRIWNSRDQAGPFQFEKRFPDSGISDAQLLGKLQLDNPISRAEIARRDRLPDNLHDSMSERDRLNRR